MSSLQIFAFGTLRLTIDGRSVSDLTSKKAHAILVYLASQHHMRHSRMVLADLFWPEVDEVHARRSLRVELHKIRMALDFGKGQAHTFLQADETHVQLDVAGVLWMDTLAFATALEEASVAVARGEDDDAVQLFEKALALYRGDLLQGLYDNWTIRERDRLSIQFEEAGQELVHRLVARQRYPQAIAIGRRLIDRNVLQETLHRDLMYAYAVSGQRTAAIEQFRVCQQVLADELGIEVSQETLDLRMLIEQQILTSGSDAVPVVSFPDARSVMAPLVGRQHELTRLKQIWLEACAGHGRVVLIEGEEGIGKTRLISAIVQILDGNMVPVLQGRCYELERTMAYQPLIEMLQTHRHLIDDRLLHSLASRYAEELVWLSIGPSELNISKPIGTFTAHDPNRQIDLFTQLLSGIAISHGRLIVLIDDLHWADAQTLAVLHYLGRRIANIPIMLVVSVRPFERAANRLQTFEDSLGRDIPGERMALQRLVEHEVIELVTLTLCHTELAEEQLVRLGRRLLRDTAGNPFFTLEILRALLDQQRLDVALRADEDSDLPLPATLREFILRRLVPLSPQARSLLNLAAVVGRTFGWKTLLRASGQDREVVLVAIEELLAHVIIHAVGEGLFDFDHEKIRSVVYQDLSDPRRRHLHTMIAQTLEQIDGEQGTHVASIAYHYLHSDVPAPALPFLILAGDKANRLQAYSEADQHYLHALDLALLQPDQEQAAQIWMKRALNAMAAGMWQKAITCQEKALALYAWLRQTPSTHAPAVGRASETFRLVTSHGNQIQIDPSFGASREAWRVASQLFEGLVQLDPRMHVVPRLATRWEVLTGGRVYRFYLQKGLRWSDGTPLTAHDFVFAWRRTLQQAQRSSLASLLFDIVGAEEIAGDTEIEPTRFGARALRDDLLEVELRAPVRSFLYVMSLTIAFPQPQHAIERFGASWTEPGKIVTCGPYQLAAWESGRRLVLERASSYTGEFTGNVGQVELFIEMNPVLRCAMYHDHNVDMLGEMTYQEMTWARLMYPTELITRPALNTSYAAFSWRRPPFDQLAVRRAMAHAIDREEIGRQLLGNVESATGGFIPPGIGGHLAGGGLMFDPALARRLLADAGYPDGQGMGPITMVSCQGLDESNASLQEQWRRHLGVEVEISILETERQFEQWFAGGYHIMRQVRSITYPDPDNWLRHALLGLQVVAPDDPLISMVRAAAVLIDDRQRTAFYRQIDQMLVADRTAILPISYDTFYWLTRPWVRGYRYGPLGHWTPFKFLEIVRPQR